MNQFDAATDAPARKLPTIQVGFDEKTQTVAVKFDPAEFRTWDFAVAALQMAVSWAEFQRDLGRHRNLQKAMLEQQQAEHISRQLRGGR